MASFLDVCRFNPTLGGTTDWTYSSAVTGYQSPVAAGAVNGSVYRYRAESSDLSQWEVGYGAYNSTGSVFARTTVLFNSSGTTSKISFSAAPQVAIIALAEDMQSSNTIYAEWFGVSAAVTDNGPLINNAISSIATGTGRKIILPIGITLKFSTTINLNNKTDIIIEGQGGVTSGTSVGTILEWTGTGSTTAISMNGAVNCEIQNLQLVATAGGGFTGYLIQSNKLTNDPSGCAVKRCTIIGSAAGCYGAYVGQSETWTFEDVRFYTLKFGILARGVTGDYSVGLYVNRCQFVNFINGGYSILGPDLCVVENCIFESTQDGSPLLMSGNYVDELCVTGCWFGDVTTVTSNNTWISLTGGTINIQGNYIGCLSGLTSYAIAIQAADSCIIKGNTIDSAHYGIYMGGSTGNIDIAPNKFNLCPVPLTGSILGYGSPGWNLLPNGMIQEYGSANVTIGTPLAITFPRVMAGVPATIQLSMTGATGSSNMVQSTAISSTGFTIAAYGGAGTELVYWFAIGPAY